MSNKDLKFKVAQLLDQGIGKREFYSVDTPVNLKDITVDSNLTFNLELMNIKESINVKITNIHVSILLQCEKCLKVFKLNIKIPFIERQFLTEIPDKIEDPEDLFLIDKKHWEIDLNNLIRQEIILHFPLISVCSNSCKGICANCGADRNKKKCNCKEYKTVNNPLSKLKDLIK